MSRVRIRFVPFVVSSLLVLGVSAAPASAGPVSISANVPAAASGTAVTALSGGGDYFGAAFSCAILRGGQVKCWGTNGLGELGQGDTKYRGDGPAEIGDFLRTVDLGTKRTAKAIATGADHACAILDNGLVKCWGYNAEGELGLGDTNYRGDNPNETGNELPYVKLGVRRKAKAITAGYNHTCVILDNGQVKCWGMNDSGQLGLGDTNNRGDDPNEMGGSLPAVNLGAGRKAKAIAAGKYHTCALLDNGKVKCWGANSDGQLGLGDTNNRGDGPNEMGNYLSALNLGTGRRAKALAAGQGFTCALLDNGSVKCWGVNGLGQLGQGDVITRGDGPNEMGDALLAVSLGTGRKAKSIDADYFHVCALLDNGSVKCWGVNSSGELGQGDTNNRGDNPGELGDTLPAVSLGTGRSAKAISLSADNTCVLLDNATVKCWGGNSHGQLGQGDTNNRGDNPGELGDTLPAVNLGVRVKSIAAAIDGNSTCAILENLTLQCWGESTSGQLGLGDWHNRGDAAGEMGNDLPAVDLGTGRSPRLLATGTAHVCAALDNGSVKCWGRNWAGQLGLGDTTYRGWQPGEMGDNLPSVNLGTNRTVKALAAGDDHNCALLDNGALKCWGWNGDGELGQGDTSTRGDNLGEMGDNLPTVNLGTGRKIKSITAGLNHTCALLDNGSVKCWGWNSTGQLGLGDTNSRGDNPGEMGDNLPAVDVGSGRKVKSIAGGVFHTCALLDNGSVKCWGNNAYGQLGVGDSSARGAAEDEMGDNLPAVDLGSGRKAVAITAGQYFTCALLDSGSVKCWGDNTYGQLGLGDTYNRGANPDQLGDSLPAVAVGGSRRVLAVTAGRNHVCALLDDHSVRCWGDNGSGNLGQGDTTVRGDDPNEMGLNLPPVALTG